MRDIYSDSNLKLNQLLNKLRITRFFIQQHFFILVEDRIKESNDIKFVRICERNSVNSLLSLSKLKNSSQKEKRNTDTSLLENSPKPPFL